VAGFLMRAPIIGVTRQDMLYGEENTSHDCAAGTGAPDSPRHRRPRVARERRRDAL